MFWYFFRSALTGRVKKDPVPFDDFIGDVGDYFEIDGVGYIVIDFVEEPPKPTTEEER